MKEKILAFYNKEWNPDEKLLVAGLAAVVGMMVGVIVGFVISPAKQGLNVLSHNGSGNGANNQDCKALGVNPKPEKDAAKEKQEQNKKDTRRLERKPLRQRVRIHSLHKEK